jgi:hypothetical protein
MESLPGLRLSERVEVVTAENWLEWPPPLEEPLTKLTSNPRVPKAPELETVVLSEFVILSAIPYVTPDDVDWPNEAELAFPGGAYKIEKSKKSGCMMEGVQIKHAARQVFLTACPSR